MKSRMAVLVLPLALVGLLAGCATDPHATDDSTISPSRPMEATAQPQISVDEMVSAWLENEEVVGVVAAVAVPGEQLSVIAAGSSNKETGVELSATESFRIGSITKMFTATLVMELVEDGILELDAKVADSVDGAHPDMTVVDLLSHTSGLPDQDIEGNIMAGIMDPSTVAAPDELIARALADDASSVPGTHQTYSSTNYLILGKLIESATGQSYETALHQRVLDPLGLIDTGFEQADTGLATPHEQPGPSQPTLPLDEFNTELVVRASWAAGGLVSTVNDLTSFANALFAGEIIGSESLDLMLDATSHPRNGYGLGVSSYVSGTRVLFGHNGRTVGFTSSLLHDVATGVTVVVLANDGTAPTGELAMELMQMREISGLHQ